MNHTLPAQDERSRQAGRLPALRDETKGAFYGSAFTHHSLVPQPRTAFASTPPRFPHRGVGPARAPDSLTLGGGAPIHNENERRGCFRIASQTVSSVFRTHTRNMAVADVIWAIGDLHGDVHCARAWLRRTGALNLSSWHWLDERVNVIFLGDYIDKGPDSRAVLELVHRLTSSFPERVTALLGNHELNLLIDRTRQPGDRYLDYAYAAAHPAQYSSWLSAIGGSPSEAEQRTLSALYAALQEVYAQGLQAKVRMAPDHPHSIVHFVAADAQRETTEHLKRWQAAYLAGVAPSTPLGAWLQQRPVTAVLGDTLFVHGGVPPALLDEHRIRSSAELAYIHEAWHNATWAAASIGEDPSTAASDAAAAAALAQSAALEAVSSLVEYRGLHDHRRGCARVARVLSTLGLRRIAVGHTPANDVRVQCGGAFVALDSALGRSFRASGNYYCDPSFRALHSPSCPQRTAACEGQVVRLERAAEGMDGWSMHVVHMEGEDAEPDQEAKLELR